MWRIDHHGSCRTFIVLRGGSPQREEPSRSDFRALGEGDCVVDIDAQVANGILDVGMTQQDLHGAKVAGCLVDERRLCSTHRVRAVFRHIETNCTDPLVDQLGILAGAEVTHIVHPAREDEIVQRATTAVEPGQQCFARFGHQLELNGSMGLLLDYRRPVSNGTAGDDVPNLHFDDVASAQLAIDGQVEQRPVP